MKIALFKLAMLADNDQCTGVAFREEEEHNDWIRVSEWVDVEFTPITIDINAAKKIADINKIEKLQNEIDKIKEKMQ